MRAHPSIRFLAISLWFGLVGEAVADTHFQSREERVPLVELYTSEGCSSCPPAESWLSELRSDEGLWTRFVPVAFHVSYWDGLGWKDPFASKELTRRQYAWAEKWHAPSVYTPCFVLNGDEWRPRKEDLAETKTTQKIGFLEVNWTARGNCAVSFRPSSPLTKRFQATVALLGGDISSSVRSGENAGRTLRHDFVAIQLVSTPLERASDGTWKGELNLTAPVPASAKRRALAAWIVAGDELPPLQSVGGWLDPKE